MSATPSCRREARIPVRVFVILYSSNNSRFEIVPTVDISCHGARVETKDAWTVGQHIAVRSIRGHLYARARVAHSQQNNSGRHVMGLEMYSAEKEWSHAKDWTDFADSASAAHSQKATSSHLPFRIAALR